jgi:membrane fusion protein, multidrug efflux system
MTEEEKDDSSESSHESEGSNDDDSDNNEENEHKPKEDKKKKPSALSNPKVRIGLIIGSAVLVVALIAFFIHHWTYGRFQQSTNDAYLGADQVSVAPRVSGYVEEVLVGDNQMVVVGQKLIRISAEDYNAAAEQSRAQIAQAQATVAQAQAQRLQQFDVIRQNLAQADQYRATLRQYQAVAHFDAVEVERYTPLSEAGAETGEKLEQYASELQQSRAQADAARAQVAASTAQVDAARHQVAYYDAQIRSGEAQIASASAQLAATMVNVRATTITSSIGGRIGDRTVRVGQYIQAGTRVMTVVPVESLYLIANFKETQLGLMRIGQPVSIDIDALPNEEIHGTVESFSPGTGSRFALVPTDNATGNFTKIVQRVPVRIRIEVGQRARQVLIPGLSASVSVDTRGAKDDAAAQKDESKQYKETRKQEHDRELEQDRSQPREGAGR